MSYTSVLAFPDFESRPRFPVISLTQYVKHVKCKVKPESVDFASWGAERVMSVSILDLLK